MKKKIFALILAWIMLLLSATPVLSDIKSDALKTSTIAKVSLQPAEILGRSKIKLSWSYAIGAQEYEIYRSLKPRGGFMLLGRTQKQFFTDNGCPANTLVYYRVRASGANPAAYGPYSAVRPAFGLNKPLSFNVKREGTSNKLSWKAVTGAGGYYVYRSDTQNGSYKLIAKLASGAREYTHSNGKAGDYYKMGVYLWT